MFNAELYAKKLGIPVAEAIKLWNKVMLRARRELIKEGFWDAACATDEAIEKHLLDMLKEDDVLTFIQAMRYPQECHEPLQTKA